MKFKEKQIEVKKLVNIITKAYPNKYSIEYPAKAIRLANELLKHYQPKLPEDKVVLAREEYEVLKIKENEKHWFETCMSIWKNAKIDSSKETAEKYKIAMMLAIQEMVKYLELTEEQAKILYHHNNEIAKQFAVEIKEK